MGQVVEYEPTLRKRLESLTLEELLREAEAYGNVSVYSGREDAPPNCYSVTIKFDTTPGTEVKAESGYRLPITTAFIRAIERADGIVNSIAGLKTAT